MWKYDYMFSRASQRLLHPVAKTANEYGTKCGRDEREDAMRPKTEEITGVAHVIVLVQPQNHCRVEHHQITYECWVNPTPTLQQQHYVLLCTRYSSIDQLVLMVCKD